MNYTEKNFINFGFKEIPVYVKGVPISRYSVIIPTSHTGLDPLDTPINVDFAASELVKYIAKITGVPIHVSADKHPLVKDYELVIGDCDRDGVMRKNYADDEYSIITNGNKLFFNGGKRGILYSVYTFLEKYCGVRFFTAQIEKIIDKERIDIGDINDCYNPEMFYREVCYWNAWDPDFSVKNKINGSFVRVLDEKHGGGICYAKGKDGLVHTFEALCPKSLIHEHPEYFALTAEGKRDHTGLCLTNEGTFNVVLNNVRKWLDESKEKIVSISINDGDVPFCHCENCKKFIENEGDYGPQVIQFIVKIANALKDEYPDALFDTIIYHQVKYPPKGLKLPDNVVLRVCGYNSRYQTVEDGTAEDVVFFRNKLNAWRDCTDNIFVWDYPANYQELNSIFPQFHVFRRNAEYFVNSKVKGMLINGNTDNCQFSELTIYVIAKLLWNPRMTEDEYQEIFNEFLEGYYGKGFRYIRKFIDYTAEICNKDMKHNSYPPKVIEPFITDAQGNKAINRKMIEKLRNYFVKCAELATEGEKYRIKKASLQVDYYELYSTMDFILKNGTEEEKKDIVKKNKEMYETLKEMSIQRIVGNTFLPVVKDFRQSPYVWDYWDNDCVFADKDNDNYDKNLYGFIENDLPVGTVVDVEFSFWTSNINADSKFRTVGENGFVFADTFGKELVWDNFNEYKTIKIKGAKIVDLQEFAKADGNPVDFCDYCFLSDYKNGIFFSVDNICAGTSFSVRDVQIKKVR